MESWRDNQQEHRRVMEHFLYKQHKFDEQSYEAVTAHEASAQTAILITRKANQNPDPNQRKDAIIPLGWKRDESFRLADMAYGVGCFAQNNLIGDSYLKVMQACLNSELDTKLPEFTEPFSDMKFMKRDGVAIKGESILATVAAHHRDWDSPRGRY